MSPWYFVVFAVPSFGQLSVELAASLPTPLVVGTPLTFTATASDTNSGPFDYQFSVARNGGGYQVAVDFEFPNVFAWTPSTADGNYSVQVIARNRTSGGTAASQVSFTVQSLVADGKPVVTATAHPLVALYSAPACPLGSTMTVFFGTGGAFNHTDRRACMSDSSMNFYIGGMLPQTTYEIFGVVSSPRRRLSSSDYLMDVSETPHTEASQFFTTGAIPADLAFPTPTVLTPPTAQAVTTQSILLKDDLSFFTASQNIFYFPNATDLNGNVLWYYSALGNTDQQTSFFIRPVTGGTFLIQAADPNTASIAGQIFREIDLAGNTIRETNATRVTEQLNAIGLLGITDFDHDAVRLPNGHTIVLCSQEKMFPAGTEGSATPIDVIGNAIVDLDANLQVVWAWSAYDHLDVNRGPLEAETCEPHQDGCPPVLLAPVASDWTHGNSLNYIPASGDLLLSMRHQDWVIKIDYNHGLGTGSTIWTLGKDGSFSIVSDDPYPWFSHQHDAEYELNGTTILSLYDNGNARLSLNLGVVHSRGVVLNINESLMSVTPVLLQDLGVISGAVGSAQRLDNGDYHFTSGLINVGVSDHASHHSEYSLGGELRYSFQDGDFCYRSYRMDSLYLLDGVQN